MTIGQFWLGKRVLVTGHTGFKGGWLSLWLYQMGAQVTGIALEPTTSPNLFTLAGIQQGIKSHIADIRDAAVLQALIQSARPEIVFHLAAQPLVRASYARPLDTYATNIMGTAHVLEALRTLDDLRVAVMVTTDKVYRNLEHPFPYRETDALGGHDPYSASKAASELVIDSYRQAFLHERGVAVASARAGNVIGGGDWSADRLIPDAVRAWQHGTILHVRRPDAIRPWQHVLEPLNGYLTLAQRLWHETAQAGAYNFGPHSHEAATVKDVISLAAHAFGRGQVQFASAHDGPHEAGWLALETAKARTVLGLAPRWTLNEAVAHTMHWYRDALAGADARQLCLAHIARFQEQGTDAANELSKDTP